MVEGDPPPEPPPFLTLNPFFYKETLLFLFVWGLAVSSCEMASSTKAEVLFLFFLPNI